MSGVDLLIVGTQGPGGIGQYITEQRRHLDGEIDFSIQQIGDFSTAGVLAFLRSVLLILGNALAFTRRSPPDVLHVHSSYRFSFYRAGFYVLFATHVWNRPVVLHIHGSSFDEFVRTAPLPVRWYQSIVFDAAAEILVLSAGWKDVVALRADREKITTLPNAVDADDYGSAFEGGVPHVAFVSTLSERKGVPELLAAAEELLDSGMEFRLSIAGKGTFSPRVEAFAAAHGDVEYLGFVSEAEKQELLGAASIFVLPSHAEGLPIALLEAMAAGNAVVSTTAGAIPEVVDEGGLLVAPGDATELAAALAELIDDPERAAAMGRHNRRLAGERYAWSTATAALLDTYEHHAERSRAIAH
ncbi:glycosyltransferase family 1 protein [Halobacteriales archaeon QS_4_69_34]|nr:MAG: glycosyltransferase family 1 protein [Halobacteriales archaeon QS_4_69_34]